jgi:pimeloyl-ACP methyl ester carboxylesterase
VITRLQQSLDRICIAAATSSVQLQRARDLIHQPDFLAPEVRPAKLDFHGRSHFTFQSTTPARWDTPTAPGRFRRAGRDWQKRPAVILLHGWNGEMGYYWSFPILEVALAAHGINALAFELPFHGKRRPRRAGEIHNLISDDIETMVAGIRHCLADALSLRSWLLEQGCPTVSLWGYSLGGWLAGLLAAHPQPFEAAILMNPVARMDIAMSTLPFAAPARSGWGETPLPLGDFSLSALRPTTKRTLIMAGERDLFVPVATLEELARQWPNTEIWRMRHSHISIVFGAVTLLRAVRWLKKQIVSNQ